MKGGIVIPNIDFTTLMLNVSDSDIKRPISFLLTAPFSMILLWLESLWPVHTVVERWLVTVINAGSSFLRPYHGRKLSNAFTKNVNGKLRTCLSVSREISNFGRFRKRVIYALNRDVMYSLTAHPSSEKRYQKERALQQDQRLAI